MNKEIKYNKNLLDILIQEYENLNNIENTEENKVKIKNANIKLIELYNNLLEKNLITNNTKTTDTQN